MTAPHGTRSRYVQNRCRCDDCTAANRAWSQQYRAVMRRHKPSRFVPAGPVIEHVAKLRASGVGVRRICVASGVPVTTVNRLAGFRCGKQPARVLKTTAEAVLAVGVRDSRWVDGTGTARRMRALIAIGHSRVQLSERTGIHVSTINQWVRGERRVTRESAARAREVYDRWWQVHPTGRGASHARGEARRHGWFSPLAWDDHTIDDPAAVPDTGRRKSWREQPDPVEVAELVAGRMSGDAAVKASRWEALRLLLEQGLSVAEVASRVSMSERSVERARARLRPADVDEVAS